MSNKKKTGFTQLDKFNIGYVQASFLSTVEIIVFSKIKALKVKNKTKLYTLTNQYWLCTCLLFQLEFLLSRRVEISFLNIKHIKVKSKAIFFPVGQSQHWLCTCLLQGDQKKKMPPMKMSITCKVLFAFCSNLAELNFSLCMICLPSFKDSKLDLHCSTSIQKYSPNVRLCAPSKPESDLLSCQCLSHPRDCPDFGSKDCFQFRDSPIDEQKSGVSRSGECEAHSGSHHLLMRWSANHS